MRRIFVSALLLCSLVGCGGGGGSASSVLSPAPPSPGQQLASEPYTLTPGTEQYYCYTFTSPPTEQAIVDVQSIYGSLVHHALLVQTLAPEPAGFSNCPYLFKTTWVPIWTAGKGTPGLTLPNGDGFTIAPNTQYLLQLHLLNASSQTVTERSGLNLTYAANPSSVTPAGIFGLLNEHFTIPAGDPSYSANVSCAAPHDMNVFAVFPHMHKIGKNIDFVAGTSSSSAVSIYQRNPWNFNTQTMDSFSYSIHAGDYMRTDCTWDNTTSAPVSFGDSTSTEMCAFVLFYTPFTSVNGCLQ